MFLTPCEFAGISQLKDTAVQFMFSTVAFPGELGTKNRKEKKYQMDYNKKRNM